MIQFPLLMGELDAQCTALPSGDRCGTAVGAVGDGDRRLADTTATPTTASPTTAASGTTATPEDDGFDKAKCPAVEPILCCLASMIASLEELSGQVPDAVKAGMVAEGETLDTWSPILAVVKTACEITEPIAPCPREQATEATEAPEGSAAWVAGLAVLLLQ